MNLYYGDMFNEFEQPKQLWSTSDLKDYELSGKWDIPAFKASLKHVMDGNAKTISVINRNLTLPELGLRGDWFEFSISNFFGNCGLCIISNLAYSGDIDGGKLALEYAIYLCERMGYSQVLYSVYIGQNDVMLQLENAGFIKLKETEMLNQRSDNYIVIYTKALNPDAVDDEDDF